MKFNLYTYNFLCKEYENSMKSKHVTRKIVKEHLNNLRQYLDNCGHKYTQPLYKYNPRDKSTWKFLGGEIIKKNNGEIQYLEELNMKFKFLGVY